MTKILVVDDIAINRVLLICLLNTNPEYDIAEAANGQEAIDSLIKHGYDIIMMDIDMPIMNGLDATKYIRANISKDIPVVAVTAHHEFEVTKWEDVGFNKIISKPIDRDEIISTIEYYTSEEYKNSSK